MSIPLSLLNKTKGDKMAERVIVNVLRAETAEGGQVLTKTAMYIHNGYYGRNILGAFLMTLPQWEAQTALHRFEAFRRQNLGHFDYQGAADVCFLNVNDKEYYGCVMFGKVDGLNPKRVASYKDYYLSHNFGLSCVEVSIVSFTEYIKALEGCEYVDGGAGEKEEFLGYLKALVKRYKVKNFNPGLLSFFNETARDATGVIHKI